MSIGAASAEEYLVISRGASPEIVSLPRGIEGLVEASGGTVIATYPEIGVLVAESDEPGFAGMVPGGVTVVPNLRVRLPEPVETGPVFEPDANPPDSGNDDAFFDLQWGVISARAQEAWAAGQRGAGVRVFVLDEGFDLDHPDLAPNLNLALSTTFVPGTTDPQYLLPDPFSHGSHVAGTIAAADNGIGVIGVAPEAELVFVKVLDELAGGRGAFSWIIAGVLYAADNGADVINMSLGTIFPQGLGPDAAEAAALRVAVNRAITYADRKGATVVVSAGNDSLDLSSSETPSYINFMGFASHAISISAVGPEGWGLDPLTDLDVPAYYTNYGTEIDFAGQGGTVDFDLLASGKTCIVAGLSRPCYVFDFVFSTGNDSWYWSVGTSMAAPHASGIAALIIGENGGDMNPAHVKREMRRRAIDVGQGSGDGFYGYGVVSSGY